MRDLGCDEFSMDWALTFLNLLSLFKKFLSDTVLCILIFLHFISLGIQSVHYGVHSESKHPWYAPGSTWLQNTHLVHQFAHCLIHLVVYWVIWYSQQASTIVSPSVFFDKSHTEKINYQSMKTNVCSFLPTQEFSLQCYPRLIFMRFKYMIEFLPVWKKLCYVIQGSLGAAGKKMEVFFIHIPFLSF